MKILKNLGYAIVPAFLFSTASAVKTLAEETRVETLAVECSAKINLNNGKTLLYKIAGDLKLEVSDSFTIELPKSQDSLDIDISAMTMTVQQFDLAGAVQTLLSRAPMMIFERIAPDADYSILPFSDEFRGLPNDGKGIYEVSGSKYGIIVSLRPKLSQPQKLQVLHYFGEDRENQYKRSAAGTCK